MGVTKVVGWNKNKTNFGRSTGDKRYTKTEKTAGTCMSWWEAGRGTKKEKF